MHVLFADSKLLLARCKSSLLEDHPNLLPDEAVEAIDSFEELLAAIRRNAGYSEVDAPIFMGQAFANVLKTDWKPELDRLTPSTQFIGRYPISLARKKLVLGFESEDNGMLVGIVNEAGLGQLDIVSRLFRCSVTPFFTTEQTLTRAINQAYQNRASQTVSNIEALQVDNDILRISGPDREDLLDVTGRPPVIRLVNSLLFDAAQDRASDIHIQPYENKLQARFRIDGVLFDQFEIPKSSQEEVLSRIKIIGKMNIAEKRLPQDGRATAEIGDRKIDLRIASLPTSHGERIVIRLLDKSAQLYTLDELGMASDNLSQFQNLIRQEHGLILVTGPTGGGKSTTLYAALQEINTTTANVVTLEDPIEYQLEGISQTQVNEKKGMTFASGLRNVLRQDPDIIMIGEIRDRETAEMAIQSALTGHLVFSTLHTNDAASSVTRLLDLGIEPYLLASSLVGVVSQRLVRRICKECKTTDADAANNWKTRMVTDPGDLSSACVGRGCSNCRTTGFRGRIGVFEMMLIDDTVRELIQNCSNAASIRVAAQASGMRLLSEDGLLKIRNGHTTVDEVVRITLQSSK